MEFMRTMVNKVLQLQEINSLVLGIKKGPHDEAPWINLETDATY